MSFVEMYEYLKSELRGLTVEEAKKWRVQRSSFNNALKKSLRHDSLIGYHQPADVIRSWKPWEQTRCFDYF